jgi:hypothetical protein
MFTSAIIFALFALMIVGIAYGYPIRKPYDPMASAHGDVPHVAPWVNGHRPF